MKLSWITPLLLLSACAHATIDLKEVERKLGTTGVEGSVHGASATHGLYVFTYRNPKDFFDFVEMSLVSVKPDLSKQLESLGRHDKIRVKGSFLANSSPQKHIEVASIEVLKKFDSGYPTPAYEYEAKIPDELVNKTSATFMVHALHSEGRILVVEYKDVVLPIFVRNGGLTAKLYRGDIVKLTFEIQTYPGRPSHLKLNEAAPTPVEVIERVLDKHGKPAVVEGALVLFPKSPDIKFNVFAILEELPMGIKRQYTLINFESADAFAKIRKKLQDAWDRYPKDYINGRNKLVSTRVRVKATGTFNEVDPDQANVQILLDSADAIEIK